MTFWKCFHHMPNGNIWNLFEMLFSFLYVIMMFPKRTNRDQDVLKTNQCDQNIPTNHMVKTFSECHWENFKCYINVPIGSRSNTWSGNIWNVPNLLLMGKWWVPSTRAYNQQLQPRIYKCSVIKHKYIYKSLRLYNIYICTGYWVSTNTIVTGSKQLAHQTTTVRNQNHIPMVDNTSQLGPPSTPLGCKKMLTARGT